MDIDPFSVVHSHNRYVYLLRAVCRAAPVVEHDRNADWPRISADGRGFPSFEDGIGESRVERSFNHGVVVGYWLPSNNSICDGFGISSSITRCCLVENESELLSLLLPMSITIE